MPLTIHFLKKRRWPVWPAALLSALFSLPAFANHGPGTSGGGSSTASGETLKAGDFDLSLRVDYTKFANVDRDEAERRAARAGGFDALEHALLLTGSAAYGITEDLQVSVQTGWYWGNNFIDAEADDGVVDSGLADPEGITDTWVAGKWRFVSGKPGNIALIGGFKIPTGRHDVHLDNGELLEASSQPGTGAWDFQLGLGYSRFLTANLTMDASALYTLRTEHDDFTVGDRFDAGIAFAYRLTESIKTFPQVSVFGEATMVWVGRDHAEEGNNPNSGGTTVFLSPGVRVRFNEHIAFTFSPAVPVWQNLNGDQIPTKFKLAGALEISF